MACVHMVDDRGVIHCASGKHRSHSPYVDPPVGISTSTPTTRNNPRIMARREPTDAEVLAACLQMVVQTAEVMIDASVAEIERLARTIKGARYDGG